MSRFLRIIGPFFSILFLYLAFRKLPLSSLKNGFREGQYWLVLPAVGFFLLSLLGRAALWKKLTGEARIPLGSFFLHLTGGLMVNNIFPGRIGEISRSYSLSREWKITWGNTFCAVIFERILDVLWLCLFTLTLFWIPIRRGWGWEMEKGILMLLAGGSLLFGVGMFVRKAGLAFLKSFLDRKRTGPFIKRIYSAIEVMSGFIREMDAERLAWSISLSLFIWICWMLFLMISLRIFHIEVPILGLIFITGVINLGVMVPSAPGYIGTFQFITIAILELFGIDRGVGASFSILFYLLWFVPSTLMGMVSWWIIGKGFLWGDRGVRDVE